jgi:hypothetical protein
MRFACDANNPLFAMRLQRMGHPVMGHPYRWMAHPTFVRLEIIAFSPWIEIL